ncbi:hypothetical protein CISIN_1g031181mg [Citrus sinensis]|uniref:Cyanobacterial aminoacyl-tRNA synthetase CAAD domain-containing protein n=1 Tax=Citrus sinensis TaxID=2711 RepID=A0A067H2Z3_CITSI|nr:hypothetical protein CISIN_1g031181mg [Citrus sinensis]
MAATAYAAVLTPRVPSTTTVKVKSSHCFALPCLPPRSSTPPFSSSIKQVSESRRFPLLQVRASSSEETSTVDADELFSDLKEKLPKLLELIGLGYTGWFVYRYLLFKSSRKELATDIEALKKKIAGTE